MTVFDDRTRLTGRNFYTLVAQWESVRVTSGKSLVQSQPRVRLTHAQRTGVVVARMLRANLKAGLCDCLDCGNGNYHGRAAENRQWRSEADADLRDDEQSVNLVVAVT